MNNPSIFISYRIDDSLTEAGRLHQSLEAKLGAKQVFYDKICLEAGMKWDEVLEEKVGAAQIVLLLYKEGKKWLGVDDFGQRRIDKADDWVRREVLTGLSQGKTVIPVLINEAKLPPEGALPESLRPLLKCQSRPIRLAYWDDDLAALVVRLQDILGTVGGLQRKQQSTEKESFQAFTCDRTDQTDAFAHFGRAFTAAKAQFFYLYGHEYQAHKSFVARLAYEFESVPIAPESPDPPAIPHLNSALEAVPVVPKRPRKAKQIHLSIKESRDPQVYREILIRDLFVAFGLDPNEHHPIVSKNLQYVLQKSPKIKELNAADAVFLLAHVSHWTWDKDLTPAAARWFITEFCQGDLPANGPLLLFFFAFDYDETYDADVKDQVIAAVAQSDHVQSLPELGMVKKRDVGAWLAINQTLISSVQTRNEILKTHFSGEEFFMEDVEKTLDNIINKYKNQHTR